MATSPTAPRATDPEEVEALHRLILASLDDDQAVETISIPLAGKTSIADYMVIASGRSTRQVASMAQKLAERIKAEFKRCLEYYQEQADAYFAAAANEQAKINFDLQKYDLEINNEYAAEDVVSLSDSFQLVGLTPTDAIRDSDVNMADWLSSTAVSASASVQVQG